MSWILGILLVVLVVLGFQARGFLVQAYWGEDEPEVVSFDKAVEDIPKCFDVKKAIKKFYKLSFSKEIPDDVVDEIVNEVEFYSRKFKLPPLLVYGIIAEESSFLPSASNHNTFGLMQVTPSTTKWIDGLYSIPYEYPPTIKSSIASGCAYLHFLSRRFLTWELVAEHYNGGKHMKHYAELVYKRIQELKKFGCERED